jgi:hypothetical protein
MWAEIYAGIRYLVPLDREAYMGVTTSCFSNPADLPPGTRTRDAAQPAQCGYLGCFSYPADVPPGTRTRNAAQSGWLGCFSYPADVPPGTRTRNAAQSAQSGWLHCFSYFS